MREQMGTGSSDGTAEGATPNRRAQLLQDLRTRSEPVTAQELAQAHGLHVTTVRFHVDALIAAGLVAAASESHPRRGRPRMLYRAVTALRPDVSPGAGYELLARVLAEHWSGPADADPTQRAEAAGAAWAAENLADGVDGDPAVVVAALFAEMGFSPVLESSADDARIVLHACPFEAVARANPTVVCALHRGLVRGALDKLGAGDTDSRLIAWDTERTCVVELMRVNHHTPPMPGSAKRSTRIHDRGERAQ